MMGWDLTLLVIPRVLWIPRPKPNPGSFILLCLVLNCEAFGFSFPIGKMRVILNMISLHLHGLYVLLELPYKGWTSDACLCILDLEQESPG